MILLDRRTQLNLARAILEAMSQDPTLPVAGRELGASLLVTLDRDGVEAAMQQSADFRRTHPHLGSVDGTRFSYLAQIIVGSRIGGPDSDSLRILKAILRDARLQAMVDVADWNTLTGQLDLTPDQRTYAYCQAFQETAGLVPRNDE